MYERVVFQGKVLGTHINVTETKEREQRTQESNTKYRIAAEFPRTGSTGSGRMGPLSIFSPFCEQDQRLYR